MNDRIATQVGHILIHRDQIQQRIDMLARQITRDRQSGPQSQNRELTLITIMTGSMIFVCDLIRRLPLQMRIYLLSLSSYQGKTTRSSGQPQISSLSNLPETLQGCDALLIDDILDSGNTLKLATSIIQEKNPNTLKSCVLLRKQRPENKDIHVDYVAFDIPDTFVVGYGLDYDGYYRNLPDIFTMTPQITTEPAILQSCGGADTK